MMRKLSFNPLLFTLVAVNLTCWSTAWKSCCCMDGSDTVATVEGMRSTDAVAATKLECCSNCSVIECGSGEVMTAVTGNSSDAVNADSSRAIHGDCVTTFALIRTCPTLKGFINFVNWVSYNYLLELRKQQTQMFY